MAEERETAIDVEGLMLWLRSRGFRTSPQQAVDARLLMVELALDGTLDAMPCDLKSLLRPVFCTDRADRARFDAAFDEFLSTVPDPTAAVSPAAPAQHPPDRLRRLKTIIAAGSVAIFVALIVNVIVLYPRATTPSEVVSTGMQSDPPIDVGRPRTEAKPESDDDSPKFTPSGVVRFHYMRTLPPPKRPFSLWWAVAAACLPGSALMAWLSWRWLDRSPSLVRGSSLTPHEAAEFSIAPTTHSLVSGMRLREIGRSLRQRRRAESRALNVPLTVAATAKAGGIPTPRFDASQELRYLVLSERRYRRDHRARLVSLLTEGLRAGGADLALYWYDGSPERCFASDPASSNRDDGWSLSELAGRYRHRTLLLIADATNLFDPHTGAVGEWTEEIFRFDAFRLVTPLPPERWAAAETIVERFLKIPILPLSEGGLGRLQRTSDATHVSFVDDASESRSAAIYRTGEIGRYGTSSPPPESVEETVSELRSHFGPAFEYLCSLAVYPELHWSITLFLGERLFPEVWRRSLAELADLPWARRGYFPEWLRERLISELSPQTDARVRAELFALLKDAARQEPAAVDDPSLGSSDRLRILRRKSQSTLR